MTADRSILLHNCASLRRYAKACRRDIATEPDPMKVLKLLQKAQDAEIDAFILFKKAESPPNETQP